MKKIISITLIATAMVVTLAGCTTSDTTGATVKTGIGHSTTATKSTSVGAEEGSVAIDNTTVALSIDDAGKIVGVVIDGIQPKVNFDATGKITTDITADIKSKRELGDDYGMKKASAIGKEWYEQMDALQTWMTGKTVEEVKAMKRTDGKADEADLKSTCTVNVEGYIAAVEEAAKNAK